MISDQEERVVSVEQFVHGKKDVLVATDIASKGLDFPNIQHVVNYDMPEDIENYGQLPASFYQLIQAYRLDKLLSSIRLSVSLSINISNESLLLPRLSTDFGSIF